LETHSGGAIAQKFTAIGSSVLAEALVTTNEQSLGRLAGLETVRWNDKKRNHEAISVTMAKAVRERAGADIGLAAVGIAPESDGLAPEEKASGKTCIAIDTADGTACWAFRFAGMDPTNQARATALAIEMLRRHLIGYADPEFPPRT
jgi:nicotinamide mononucleotide (NMN) deamidase PncC